MLPNTRGRPQQRPPRSWSFSEMVDFSDPKRRPRYLSKVIMVALLTAMCVVMLTQPPCHRRTPSVVSPFYCYDLFFTSVPVLAWIQLKIDYIVTDTSPSKCLT